MTKFGNYKYQGSQVRLLAVFSRYAAAILCHFLLQNEEHLTCTLRGGYIGASLVSEEQSAVIRTGVDVARWIRARAMTTVVRKGHGSAKGTGYRRCFLAEHRVQQRIPRNIWAESWQAVFTVTVSCKRKLIDINLHVPIITRAINQAKLFIFFVLGESSVTLMLRMMRDECVRKSDEGYSKVISNISVKDI